MKQRDIVLVPFPFSDQSGQKIRPALVLSNNIFNKTSNDILACAVTTNLKPSKFTVIIDKNDVEEGMLYEKSAVKAESIFKLQKSLVLKSIAAINKQTFLKTTELIADLIELL